MYVIHKMYYINNTYFELYVIFINCNDWDTPHWYIRDVAVLSVEYGQYAIVGT